MHFTAVGDGDQTSRETALGLVLNSINSETIKSSERLNILINNLVTNSPFRRLDYFLGYIAAGISILIIILINLLLRNPLPP